MTSRSRVPARARLRVTVATPDGPLTASRTLSSWLINAAPSSARGELTVALVSDGRMRTLNRAFRAKDYATDVLSFPAANSAGPGSRATGSTNAGLGDSSAGPYLGDIVIATGMARRQAQKAGHPLGTELRVLALHGLLHLLGYDHETDKGQMARAEARLRKKAGLKAGLIDRRGHTKSRARAR